MVEDDAFLEDHQERALCIRCGASKFQPYDRCEKCELQPQGEDLLKSVYLSVWRYDDPEKQATWSEDLVEVRQAGVASYSYDQGELERLSVWMDEVVGGLRTLPLVVGALAAVAVLALVATVTMKSIG